VKQIYLDLSTSTSTFSQSNTLLGLHMTFLDLHIVRIKVNVHIINANNI